MFGLTEAMLEWFGYDTIAYFSRGVIFLGLDNLRWAFHPMGTPADRSVLLKNAFRLDRGFACGVWTGPENDLLCIKRCRTNEETKVWLSPLAATPFGSVVAAAMKSVRLGRLPRVRLGIVERNGGRECGICGWKMGHGELPEISESYENPGVKEFHCPACGHWLDTVAEGGRVGEEHPQI